MRLENLNNFMRYYFIFCFLFYKSEQNLFIGRVPNFFENNVIAGATDTIIQNAILVDSITDRMIDFLPSHIAISFRFKATQLNGNRQELNVLFYNPEAYGKNFFAVGNRYRIYGNLNTSRIVFQYAKEYSDKAPFIYCDSIALIK